MSRKKRKQEDFEYKTAKIGFWLMLLSLINSLIDLIKKLID